MPADVLTVTMNPTLDISTSVDALVNHVKLRCSPEREQVGGGGINVAHVIHCLGADCQAMLPVGGTRGQEITARLRGCAIPLVTTTIAEQNRECFNVFETSTGHEYRFVLPGPKLTSVEQAAAIRTIVENLPTQFLVLSGSLPPGLSDDFYAQVIRAARAKAPALRIVADTSGTPLIHALEAGVFMFKPSREEFAALVNPATDTGTDTTADDIKRCRALINQGKARVVSLTLGDKGALIVTDQHAWQVSPLPVPISSTVGAGDSFVGGMVWSLLNTDDLGQAARVATACAAQALQTQGALQFDAQTVLLMSEAVEIVPLSLPLTQ